MPEPASTATWALTDPDLALPLAAWKPGLVRDELAAKLGIPGDDITVDRIDTDGATPTVQVTLRMAELVDTVPVVRDPLAHVRPGDLNVGIGPSGMNDPICGDEHDDGSYTWTCTREPDHPRGQHVACGLGAVGAVWPVDVPAPGQDGGS